VNVGRRDPLLYKISGQMPIEPRLRLGAAYLASGLVPVRGVLSWSTCFDLGPMHRLEALGHSPDTPCGGFIDLGCAGGAWAWRDCMKALTAEQRHHAETLSWTGSALEEQYVETLTLITRSPSDAARAVRTETPYDPNATAETPKPRDREFRSTGDAYTEDMEDEDNGAVVGAYGPRHTIVTGSPEPTDGAYAETAVYGLPDDDDEEEGVPVSRLRGGATMSIAYTASRSGADLLQGGEEDVTDDELADMAAEGSDYMADATPEEQANIRRTLARMWEQREQQR
jgi:hypothetical protein